MNRQIIIGLAGRMGSGKSALAKVCENYGYKRINFALPLKTLVCTLFNIESIEILNSLKKTESSYVFTEEICKNISDITDINLKSILKECKGKELKTIREVLQFLGTDVIRKYNQSWHLQKLKEMIDSDKKENFIIDDVRFPNEAEFVKNKKGTVWFVIRAKTDNISNHISETSLKWTDFKNNIIINNGNLEDIIHKWGLFVENYNESCKIKRRLSKLPDKENDLYDKYFVYPEIKKYYKSTRYNENIKSLETNTNGKGFIVEYKTGIKKEILDPILVENLKIMYNKKS